VRLVALLAEVEVGLFAASTFDTGDLLVKVPNWDRALQALRAYSHVVHAQGLRT
jgi:hypothetical protein